MKRRAFFGALLSSPAVAALYVTSKPEPRHTYGLMTPDRWRLYGFYPDAKVLVDGVNITAKCTQFNDAEGWAEVKVTDLNNKFKKFALLHGDVRVVT